MSLTPKQKLLVGLFALLSLAFVCFLLLTASRSAVQAEVRFLGYTTNAAGVRLVRFEIQNKSSFPIESGPFQQYLFQSPQGWQAMRHNPAPPIGPVLQPEDKEIIDVTGPSPATEPWRLRVTYCEYRSPLERTGKALLRLIGIRSSTICYGFESDPVKP